MHREAARTQVSRIEAAIQGSRTDRPEPGAEVSQAESSRATSRRGVERMRSVLCEVHFYFVAWGNCRNTPAILTGQPEMLEAKNDIRPPPKELRPLCRGPKQLRALPRPTPRATRGSQGQGDTTATRRRAHVVSTPGLKMAGMCIPTRRGISHVRACNSSRESSMRVLRVCIELSMRNSFAKECRPNIRLQPTAAGPSMSRRG